MNVPFDVPDNVGIESAGEPQMGAGALEGMAAMDPMGFTAPGWINGVNLSTRPVRERIIHLMADQRQRQQAARDDGAISQSLAISERENTRLQELQDRYGRAMERLSAQAPTMQEPKGTTGELVAALLTGLATGDGEQANKMLMGRAADRARRQMEEETARYQADQRGAGLEAGLLQDQMQRSQGVLDRLETFRLGRETDLIDRAERNRIEEERFTQELAFRRQEREAKDAAVAAGDARDTMNSIRQNLRMTGNPGLARIWIGEHNDMAAQFGGRAISPEEEADILRSVKSKYKQDGVEQVRLIVKNYVDEARANGGKSTPDMVYKYSQLLKIAAEEFEIEAPELPVIDEYNLDGQMKIDSNNRANRKLDLEEERTRASIEDTVSKIKQRDAKTAMDIQDFLLKSSESPSVKRIQDKVQDLRAQQRGLKAQFDEMQQEQQGLEVHTEQERIEKGYQDRYLSLRAQLREMRGKLTRIEGEIKGYAEVQKNLPKAPAPMSGQIGGELPAIKGVSPLRLDAPGVSTSPVPKPKSKPAPKGKAAPKGGTSSFSDDGKQFGF